MESKCIYVSFEYDPETDRATIFNVAHSMTLHDRVVYEEGGIKVSVGILGANQPKHMTLLIDVAIPLSSGSAIFDGLLAIIRKAVDRYAVSLAERMDFVASKASIMTLEGIHTQFDSTVRIKDVYNKVTTIDKMGNVTQEIVNE